MCFCGAAFAIYYAAWQQPTWAGEAQLDAVRQQPWQAAAARLLGQVKNGAHAVSNAAVGYVGLHTLQVNDSVALVSLSLKKQQVGYM